MQCKMDDCANEAKSYGMCQKHYNKYWYEQNKEKILEKKKEYYLQNKERHLCYVKAYHKTKKGREIKRKQKQRAKKLPKNKVIRNTYQRLREILKNNKSDNTMNLVGCSPNFLRQHLESQFQPGMSWDNYGKWHIDHIRPCCSFDLTDPAQQRQCFHYSNLQPLWAEDNIRKGGKWDANTGCNIT